MRRGSDAEEVEIEAAAARAATPDASAPVATRAEARHAAPLGNGYCLAPQFCAQR